MSHRRGREGGRRSPEERETKTPAWYIQLLVFVCECVGGVDGVNGGGEGGGGAKASCVSFLDGSIAPSLDCMHDSTHMCHSPFIEMIKQIPLCSLT